jgi:hypothetical protein
MMRDYVLQSHILFLRSDAKIPYVLSTRSGTISASCFMPLRYEALGFSASFLYFHFFADGFHCFPCNTLFYYI